MGDPFNDVTVLNYNQNPPPDDGSATDANEVKWATHKNKLSDPLKTAIESLNTNTGAAVDKLVGGAGVAVVSTAQTLGESVQGQLVRVTVAGITVTTPDAASLGAPFVFDMLNNSSGSITLDGNGSQTIDGVASLTLTPGSGVQLHTDGSNWFTAGQNFTAPYPRGHIGGVQLANAADTEHDITIAVGSARDSSDTFNLDLATALTKQIDVNWMAGSGQGGFPSTGISLSPATWYHVFLVDDGSGNTDAGFDTSLIAANLLSDSGGSFYRRIGSVLTDGTNNILAFTQVGDDFIWANPPLDVNDSSAGTSAELGTLSTPLGVKVLARINAYRDPDDVGDDRVYISSPDANDESPAVSAAPLASASEGANTPDGVANEFHWTMTVHTNMSSQVRYRANDSDTLRIVTLGWTDSRGRHD